VPSAGRSLSFQDSSPVCWYFCWYQHRRAWRYHQNAHRRTNTHSNARASRAQTLRWMRLASEARPVGRAAGPVTSPYRSMGPSRCYSAEQGGIIGTILTKKSATSSRRVPDSPGSLEAFDPGRHHWGVPVRQVPAL
jgi:hypothetical protein